MRIFLGGGCEDKSASGREKKVPTGWMNGRTEEETLYGWKGRYRDRWIGESLATGLVNWGKISGGTSG